ncbi:hypothetical protein PENANT_c024G00386 [Penicillium antarcticum]|uniref:Uncharacterized protein n=1 Tax=Penicillium antarcticum TaxID=416450 RepID=A0A1V6PZ13_9EURO|nr:uncharacterized protein N7508_005108 [Penicillium antarcticum]KAJ5306093.1 hypothetical protein N7508_005108 [Penicillium antarcticum]OQD82017.1 hypothetical protein PENANT_c024G00386 [Penicillium antarcticum]
MSDSFTSSSYYYSSTASGNDGQVTTGHRYSTTSHTESDGTTIVRTAHQDLGQPAMIEERRYDSTGQEQLSLPEPLNAGYTSSSGSGATSAGGVRRIVEIDEEDDTPTPTSTPGVVSHSGPILAGGAAAQLLDGDGDDFDIGVQPRDSRVYNPMTDAYDQLGEFDVDHVTGQHRRMIGSGASRDVGFRQFEDPSTGARVPRQSGFDVNNVI